MVVGDQAPDAAFERADGTAGRVDDYRGRPLVLYFYPKDDTPGCTNEAKEFSALLGEFEALGVAVLGASKDTTARHAKFTARHALTVQLASDTTGELCAAFGVWGERQMYGRTYQGIERATFLIDGEGVVRRVWRKVRVAGHAEEVLAAAAMLRDAR
jgi:thioredoxin-dependent peroxiredoxin